MQHSAVCAVQPQQLEAQQSMNDETYLADWFCFAFASRGHQCVRRAEAVAERLLVSYRPLAHDVGFQGPRAFRIAASGL